MSTRSKSKSNGNKRSKPANKAATNKAGGRREKQKQQTNDLEPSLYISSLFDREASADPVARAVVAHLSSMSGVELILIAPRWDDVHWLPRVRAGLRATVNRLPKHQALTS